MDPTRDLLWARLGDAHLSSAPKQTDAAEKAKRYTDAVSDYQKAIDLKKKTMEATPKPDDADTWPRITTIWGRPRPEPVSSTNP